MAKDSSAKAVLEALAAARKRGNPYLIIFSTTGPGENVGKQDTPAPDGGRGADGGRDGHTGESGDGGGSSARVGGEDVATSGTESGEQMTGETAPHGSVQCILGQTPRGETEKNRDDNGLAQQEGKSSDSTTGEIGAECVASTDVGLPREDGEVTLMYEMYDEKFPIKVIRSFCACSRYSLCVLPHGGTESSETNHNRRKPIRSDRWEVG